jgi:hypothetical protein
MKIEIIDTIGDDLLESTWDLYHGAFEELNALAVQRHLMHRPEFDEVMRDRRVQKYVARADGGELLGLSTYTNELDAMPLISPAYFERRWPDLFAEQRIWYCGFVATHPDRRAAQAYGHLCLAMYRAAEERAGLIALDFCRYNDEVHHMSRSVNLLLRRASGGRVRAHQMDEQSFWLYDTRPADEPAVLTPSAG